MAVEQHSAEVISPLDALSNALTPDMEAVNAAILTRMTSDIALINQVAAYLISAGGKRIRPLLTLAFTDMLSGDKPRAHGLAATVEFIHTATLLHDDVVDESAERRGQASANAAFGNQASVLVGDFLFSRAFQLMVADGSLDTLRILSDASAVIAEGEVLQLQMQGNLDTTWDQYRQMIGAKTAALFAAACEVGAVASGAYPDVQKAARDYGYELGLAFQIADDVLDYAGENLGKTVGDDFREGKISAPILLSYAQAESEERAFWQRTIRDHKQSPEDLPRAQEYLQNSLSIDQGLECAAKHAANAQKTLETLPSSPLKDLMHDLCDYVVKRSY